MLGEEACHGAPDQRYEVFRSHDNARHRRSQAKLSEVQGEEGKQAGLGTAAQEAEGAGQSQGTLNVNLLVPFHDGGQLTVIPDRFRIEHLFDRQRERDER